VFVLPGIERRRVDILERDSRRFSTRQVEVLLRYHGPVDPELDGLCALPTADVLDQCRDVDCVALGDSYVPWIQVRDGELGRRWLDCERPGRRVVLGEHAVLVLPGIEVRGRDSLERDSCRLPTAQFELLTPLDGSVGPEFDRLGGSHVAGVPDVRGDSDGVALRNRRGLWVQVRDLEAGGFGFAVTDLVGVAAPDLSANLAAWIVCRVDVDVVLGGPVEDGLDRRFVLDDTPLDDRFVGTCAQGIARACPVRVLGVANHRGKYRAIFLSPPLVDVRLRDTVNVLQHEVPHESRLDWREVDGAVSVSVDGLSRERRDQRPTRLRREQQFRRECRALGCEVLPPDLALVDDISRLHRRVPEHFRGEPVRRHGVVRVRIPLGVPGLVDSRCARPGRLPDDDPDHHPRPLVGNAHQIVDARFLEDVQEVRPFSQHRRGDRPDAVRHALLEAQVRVVRRYRMEVRFQAELHGLPRFDVQPHRVEQPLPERLYPVGPAGVTPRPPFLKCHLVVGVDRRVYRL